MNRRYAEKVLGWRIPRRPPNGRLGDPLQVEGTPLHAMSPEQKAFVVGPQRPVPRFLEEPAAAVALCLRLGDLATVTEAEVVGWGESWEIWCTWTEEGEQNGTGEKRHLDFAWHEAAEVLSERVFPNLGSGDGEKGRQRSGFSVEEFRALIAVLARVRVWLDGGEDRWFRLTEEPSHIWRARLAGGEEGRTSEQLAPTPGAAVAHALVAELARDVEHLEDQVRQLEEQVEAGVVFEEVVPNLDVPGSTDPKELRAWRKRLDLTQQLAGDLVGVTRSAWQKWELDDNPPPDWLLLAIEGAMLQERRNEEE